MKNQLNRQMKIDKQIDESIDKQIDENIDKKIDENIDKKIDENIDKKIGEIIINRQRKIYGDTQIQMQIKREMIR